LLIHQDRVARDGGALSLETALAEICPWMDFVVWGHEHENCIEPQVYGQMHITQPGSTVRTQLRKPIAPNHAIGILTIFEGTHDFTCVGLQSCPVYVYRSMTIDDFVMTLDDAIHRVREELESMIVTSERPPLIRLTVKYQNSSLPMCSLKQRMIVEFGPRAANSRDIIQLQLKARKKTPIRTEPIEPVVEHVSLFDIIERNLAEVSPALLEPAVVLEGLRSFLGHDEKTAFQANILPFVDSLADFIVDSADGPIADVDAAAALIDCKRAELPVFSPRARQPEIGVGKGAVSSDEEDASPQVQTRRVLAQEAPPLPHAQPMRRRRGGAFRLQLTRH
jgi:hypothetical protein